jgi:hypothetical protein
LFADDALAANALYAHLAEFAEGGPLFLDVPENTPPQWRSCTNRA